jgi:hypothetical protein
MFCQIISLQAAAGEGDNVYSGALTKKLITAQLLTKFLASYAAKKVHYSGHKRPPLITLSS